MFSQTQVLVTLGPSSLNEDTVRAIAAEGVDLFRINLSHAPLETLRDTIAAIQRWTDVPVCLDTEGAQIRNQSMQGNSAVLETGSTVTIHFDTCVGDAHNISFTPASIAKQLVIDDRIRIDFDSVCLRVVDRSASRCTAIVEEGGVVGSNKAADLGRHVELEPITAKDEKAIAIGRAMNVRHFALSFANSSENVLEMRALAGEDACVIAKIESIAGAGNLHSILQVADQILIDRGDLSRQVAIEKIPFLQRRIISLARSRKVPVHVATNLLESTINSKTPTRAEVNDVVSTLLMGADGLVLAAETAIGKYPLAAVRMVRKLIAQTEMWTPNSSIDEILESTPHRRDDDARAVTWSTPIMDFRSSSEA